MLLSCVLTAACCMTSVAGHYSHGTRGNVPPPPLISLLQAPGRCLPLWQLWELSLCCRTQRWAATHLDAPAAPWQIDTSGLQAVPWWAYSHALHAIDQKSEVNRLIALMAQGMILFLLLYCICFLLLGGQTSDLLL